MFSDRWAVNSGAAPSGSGGKGDPLKGVFMEVGGIADFYYESEPGKYALVPDQIRRSYPQFSPQSLEYKRAELRRERDKGRLDRINDRANQRWRLERGDQRADAAARNSIAQGELALRRQQVAQQGAQARTQAEIERERIGLNRSELASNSDYRNKQINELINSRIEANKLTSAELAQRGSQFEQTLAAKLEESRNQSLLTSLQIQNQYELGKDELRFKEQQHEDNKSLTLKELGMQRRGQIIGLISQAAKQFGMGLDSY